MSSIRFHDAEVLWQLTQPPFGPGHSYFKIRDLDEVMRLQSALEERGLPRVRLVPQYRKMDGEQTTAIAICACRDNSQEPPRLVYNPQAEQLEQCARELSIDLEMLPTRALARYFRLPEDYATAFDDFYHWDPFAHRWRLEEVNTILLRYGLPKRSSLEFGEGRIILHILGIYRAGDSKTTVRVRYAILNTHTERAYTDDVAYDKKHDVLACLATNERVAVHVIVDQRRELETWQFPLLTMESKPTNTTLRMALAPNVGMERFHVSSLGHHNRGTERRVFRLIRILGRSAPLELSELSNKRELTWKTWDEIKRALEDGKLDPSTELMVTRLLRHFPEQDRLFSAG